MNDQRSLLDQLKSLVILANKNGLYDAADFVQARVSESETSEPIAPRKRVKREQASARGGRSRKTKEPTNTLQGWSDIINGRTESK